MNQSRQLQHLPGQPPITAMESTTITIPDLQLNDITVTRGGPADMRRLELETKIVEAQAKFSNHGEGPY